jgi:peptidyl-prolyl cis-trans isomerase A (cyclophilin A)
MRAQKFFGASAVLLAAAALSALLQAAPAPADKRKPGLYWTIDTDKGAISCKLYEAEAPVTVHTMVGLALGKISFTHPETMHVVRKKFFDGLVFDRVIPNALIQGGDVLGTGVGHPQGPAFPYKNEIAPSLKFDTAGRLGMANSGPDTNDTHFFITLAPSPSMSGKYTIWGQCENLDVVKAIASVPRDPGDTPLTPVHIRSVIVERVGPAPADAPEAQAESGPAPSN